MNTWLHNPIFPGVLHTTASNLEEYYEAIIELLNPTTIQFSYYEETFEDTIYPLDNNEWRELFLKDTFISDYRDFNNIKLKPSTEDFPILIHFLSNHKYLHWTSLNGVK